MDMLLVGANCITLEEEKTQLAIWAISASPLIMGNDLRKVPSQSRALLLNRDAIPISQIGVRLPGFTSDSPQQVWARRLGTGAVAVVLYNKLGAKSRGTVGPRCPSWHSIQG